MNLKKKFVIGAASLALVAGMGVAPAMAAAGMRLSSLMVVLSLACLVMSVLILLSRWLIV